MKKKMPLIGVSAVTVILLVVGSLNSIVVCHTVQASYQKVKTDEINQKELLFQTIVDIANNKEIQRIILKLRMNREGFFNPDLKFLLINTPVLTKNQLKHLYFIGLVLSKTISKSKIHSIVEKYQVNNQIVQKEITTVIEKDTTLYEEIKQLSNLGCDCENKNTSRLWNFPVLCIILYPITLVILILYYFSGVLFHYIPVHRPPVIHEVQ